MKQKSLLLFISLFLLTVSGWCQQRYTRVELKNFKLQSSVIVHENGTQLSIGPYQGKAYWFPVKVPTTVLGGLVANKVYPSPYIGMNNMYIPDASDSFNTAYHLGKYSFLPHHKNPWKDPYWYRTEFKLPQSYAGKHVWLTFKGINYRAAVWLNGKQIADSTQMVGMFEQYRFDVTNLVKEDGPNYLAVKIYQLDDPGLPAPPQLKALGPFFANGGPTGDIGKNVTMLCSVGWDWMPAVRDREMGIWQPVYLSASGSVTIDQPHVVTELPDLPDTNRADIKLQMTLSNHSQERQRGQLEVTIKPHNFSGSSITFTRKEELKGGETKDVSLESRRVKELRLTNPHLWWPNGQGRANLYDLQLRYVVDGQVSQSKDIVFGVRTVSSKVTDVNGWARRDFYVNGRRIHLVGGAWVPDLLLQRDSTRYANELELIRNDHLNLVRIWGGGIAPPDDFFEAADRLGLLVWQDFWITGDTQGQFKGSPDWPLQGDVFIRNMKSTIIRLRNHPSLLVWTGGNEGHARQQLYDAMRENVAQLDGTRPFIPCSSGFAKLPKSWKLSWPDNKNSGVYSGGPYSWQDPVHYYDLVNAGKDWVFKDEVGVPSQVPYSDLSKVIPDLVPDDSLPYPLNNTWGYHDACAGNGKYQTYYKAIVDRYGEPTSYKDYSEKSQLVNANSYRAIFESVNSKLDATGGVMLWKINAAFPSVIWQLYDWYLEPNAGYYFTQRACEPLHVQFNLDDSTVVVINKKVENQDNLNVHTLIYDLQGQKLYDQQKTVDAAHQNVTTVSSLKDALMKAGQLAFVVLDMSNASGQPVSQNVYWLAPGNKFESLSKLSSTSVKVSVEPVSNAKEAEWKVTLDNPTDQLAFFVHPSLNDSKGDEILPTFWSDNYVTLAPHQSMTLTVRANKSDIAHKWLHVKVKGWNVPSQTIPVSAMQ